MAKAKPKTSKDYEQLGRLVANIYESGYLDRGQTYKMTFMKGVLGGVGGVLGATIVIALLLWFLSLFKQVPIVGPFVNNVRHTVQEKQN